MCANPYGPLGSPHNFGYLRIGAFLKPMELDNLALAGGELLQRDVEELGALAKL